MLKLKKNLSKKAQTADANKKHSNEPKKSLISNNFIYQHRRASLRYWHDDNQADDGSAGRRGKMEQRKQERQNAWYKGSTINDVTQFWTIFHTHTPPPTPFSPLVTRFTTKAFVLLSQNP